MKQITREMLKIYKPFSNLDWMNYKIVRKSDLTFHHIIKKCDGGKELIENGALLLPNSHQYLHLIEIKDLNTYLALNDVFLKINRQLYEPTLEERESIESLLLNFESSYKHEKNSKGKVLIRREYLRRW